MKKLRALIVGCSLMFQLTALYSQFYDVKIVRHAIAVGTHSETKAAGKAVIRGIGARGETPVKNQNTQAEANEADERKAAPTDSVAQVRYFALPIDTLVVSSPYGYRRDPFTGKRKFHAGTDYLTASETVRSMMPGRIRKIDYDRKLGNYVTIEHGDLEVTYAHLHTAVGDKGDYVAAGQPVGISGSTGRSTGEHLHVAVKFRGKRMDPDPIIRLIGRYAMLGTVDPALVFGAEDP